MQNSYLNGKIEGLKMVTQNSDKEYLEGVIQGMLEAYSNLYGENTKLSIPKGKTYKPNGARIGTYVPQIKTVRDSQKFLHTKSTVTVPQEVFRNMGIFSKEDKVELFYNAYLKELIIRKEEA